jgi:hypothetical protein
MKSRSLRKLVVLLVGPILFTARSWADDSEIVVPAPSTQQGQWHIRTPGGGGGGGGFGASFGGGGFGAAVNGTGGNGGVAVFSPNARINVPVAGLKLTDAPAVISTEPMDSAGEAKWREDLSIMDKVLHNELPAIAADNTPRAMGIRLSSSTDHAPMYIEGCGAVFSASVTLPLATGDDQKAGGDEHPKPTSSAWDRAKGEIGFHAGQANGSVQFFFAPESVPFDQSKLDNLINCIVKVLPEAAHIGGLKDDEAVIVTITGTDDAGIPKRLTLKARKSDIDAAASGKIKPDDFAQRVAHSVM